MAVPKSQLLPTHPLGSSLQLLTLFAFSLITDDIHFPYLHLCTKVHQQKKNDNHLTVEGDDLSTPQNRRL